MCRITNLTFPICLLLLLMLFLQGHSVHGIHIPFIKNRWSPAKELDLIRDVVYSSDHDGVELGKCSSSEYGYTMPAPWSSCTTYLVCKRWGVYRNYTIAYQWKEMPCAPSTLWNAAIGMCDFEYNVQCEERRQCNDGEVCFDLSTTAAVSGELEGLSIIEKTSELKNGKDCSRQAVFKIEFEKLPWFSEPDETCFLGTYAGRRMLKIQMYFSDGERSRWVFDLGDSKSNNGWGGDARHSDFSAEVHGFSKRLDVFSNTRNSGMVCNKQSIYSKRDGVVHNVTNVNVYVANHFLKVTNDKGLNDEICDECLFGLNGQHDYSTNAEADRDIYFAANRVIMTDFRRGYGLCALKMRWVDNADE